MRVTEGVVLGGRYRMVGPIAVGGMGEVWEALDESLGRPVAVKALRPEFAGESTLLARFRVEARNSAALSHPNIAPLFDYGEDDGTAYLVMELVPGQPLSDILEDERVLVPQRLLPILSQTARGLHYAHQMGVVHRDVKPGNLLVEPSGRVRITDFGVSQAINQTPMTATGMVMGTAQYLSPEQAVGKPATRLSDLYALGIIAYEALVGQRPFTGASPVDIAIAQVNDPVPPLPSTVEPRLASLVLRLLDKNPAGRPQSGDELAALFDTLVASTPPSGVPVAARTRAAPPLRTRDEASTVTPVGGLPPSFVPRAPAEPERAPVSAPVTVGPRPRDLRGRASDRPAPRPGRRAQPSPRAPGPAPRPQQRPPQPGRRTTTGSQPPRPGTTQPGTARPGLSHLGSSRLGSVWLGWPLWLRWTLAALVVVVVVWLVVLVGQAAASAAPGAIPADWAQTPAVAAVIPILLRPSTVRGPAATDSGGQL
ncbi:MAG: protein kinase [Micrococcales bacterium]|nr:protein kinase [Micrococcales bacterium]